MASLKVKVEIFTLAAHKVSAEHDAAGRSQRNRTTDEAAPANTSADEDEDATTTSINAPEALSNIQLRNVACK